MKKILAIALALCMAMALSVSVFADYTMTATSGQDFDGKVLADGVELTGDWYTDKLSTNWVNSDEFNAIMAALQEEGSVLTLTYTGEISAIGFQSSIGEIKVTDLTVTTDGDVTTATVAGAALLSDPSVLDGYDWCNLMVQATAGTILKSFTISTGSAAAEPEAPADEPEATEPEAPADEPETTEPEAPAAEPEAPAAEPTAPSTGLALAVVPAVVAMAAAFISKKH